MYLSITKLFSMVIILSSCSEKLNINALFVTSKHKQRFEYLMEHAQLSYDRGKYSDAKTFVDKARELAPNNEDAAILSGYVELGLAGLSTFDIAKAMIKSGKDSTALAESSGASTLFKLISGIMNVSDDDYRNLGEVDDGSTKELFEGIDLIIPVSVTEARDGRLKQMTALNDAIMSVCRFVDPSAKLEEDPRHSSAACESTEEEGSKNVLASFLWAFAHLGEASIYYSVVQYTSENEESANLQRRSDVLTAEKDSLSLGDYADHAVDLADDITSVIDVINEESMFNGLINGIRATSLAFATMGDSAKDLQKSVDKAMDEINEKKDQVSADTEQGQQAAAFKAKLGAGIASSLAEQIASSAADNPGEFAENKDKLCSAYIDVGGLETLDECQ